MRDDSEKSYRRSLRLSNYNYSQSGAYFITICIHNRECLLGKIDDGMMILNNFGTIVRETWNSLSDKYSEISLDEWTVMPNHIHGIVIIDNPNADTSHELQLQRKERRTMLLPKAIGYFKMNSSKQINELRGRTGQPLWQKNYYEHIIRNPSALEKIREYIVNNPRKWHEDIENQQGTPSQEEINFLKAIGRRDHSRLGGNSFM